MVTDINYPDNTHTDVETMQNAQAVPSTFSEDNLPQNTEPQEFSYSGSETQEVVPPDVLNMTDEEYLRYLEEEEKKKKQGYGDPQQTDHSVTQPNEPELSVDNNTHTEPEKVNMEEVSSNTSSTGSETVSLTPDEFKALVTGEFTANGRKVRVEDPNKIIQLMQQGYGYNKKMQELKPVAGLVRTLKDHGITEASDLQFLLDIKQGDPEAIAKLLKDHNIDTYSLPSTEEQPYVGKAQVVNSQEAYFLDTIENLQSLPQGESLLKDLANKNLWDEESLKLFKEHPQALEVLHQDKISGFYDQVMNIIQTDRDLGNIPEKYLNVPVATLYEYVAEYLTPKGNANVQQQQPQQTVPVQQQRSPQQPRVVGNNIQTGYIQQQQHSAPRSANVNTAYGSPQQLMHYTEEDIMNMSDEQFKEYSKTLQRSGLRF